MAGTDIKGINKRNKQAKIPYETGEVRVERKAVFLQPKIQVHREIVENIPQVVELNTRIAW
ncbi:MAG: hypothetical protein WBJ10_15020 [Daejeonella sp.]|uniref:hypothetical protein n=1 Tax=Daejeonella sp. TaxID=2805397 RepID=UPI003C7290A2